MNVFEHGVARHWVPSFVGEIRWGRFSWRWTMALKLLNSNLDWQFFEKLQLRILQRIIIVFKFKFFTNFATIEQSPVPCRSWTNDHWIMRHHCAITTIFLSFSDFFRTRTCPNTSTNTRVVSIRGTPNYFCCNCSEVSRIVTGGGSCTEMSSLKICSSVKSENSSLRTLVSSMLGYYDFFAVQACY